MLIAHGALSHCSAVLIALGGAVAKGNLQDGLELVNRHSKTFTFYNKLPTSCTYISCVHTAANGDQRVQKNVKITKCKQSLC